MTYKIITKNPKISSIVIEVGTGKDAHRIDVRVPATVTDTQEVEVKTIISGVDGEPDTESVEVITESFERPTTLEDVHTLLEATAANVIENNAIAKPAALEDVFSKL